MVNVGAEAAAVVATTVEGNPSLFIFETLFGSLSDLLEYFFFLSFWLLFGFFCPFS